jgi:hypothetical protein
VTTHDLLALLRLHAPAIRASFSGDRLTALGDRIRDLADAGDDETAVRRALLDIRKSLLLNLPADNELRDKISREVRSGTPVPAPPADLLPDAGQLAEVMALLASVDWPRLAPQSAALARGVRRRLLDAPARGADRLTTGAARDPLRAGLIRLTDHGGGARYPEFQFDPDTGEPRPVVQEINRLLLADEDPWGVADWWLGGNVWLRGAPADLLGDVPDELLVDAARALVEDGAW